MNEIPPSEPERQTAETDPAGGTESEEDFVHESVDLPEWVPVAFGVLLVVIAAVAIWTA